MVAARTGVEEVKLWEIVVRHGGHTGFEQQRSWSLRLVTELVLDAERRQGGDVVVRPVIFEGVDHRQRAERAYTGAQEGQYRQAAAAQKAHRLPRSGPPPLQPPG